LQQRSSLGFHFKPLTGSPVVAALINPSRAASTSGTFFSMNCSLPPVARTRRSVAGAVCAISYRPRRMVVRLSPAYSREMSHATVSMLDSSEFDEASATLFIQRCQHLIDTGI